MTPFDSATHTLVTTLVLAAAATDLHRRRIPNWLTFSGAAAGLFLNAITSGWAGVKNSLLGMILGFGFYLLLYSLRAMGAGDVKLMAAVGAMVGPGHWLLIFMASAVAGGVLALLCVLWKGRLKTTLWNTFFIVQELAHGRAPFQRHKHLDVKDSRALTMPHGVAIAAGTMACLSLAVI